MPPIYLHCLNALDVEALALTKDEFSPPSRQDLPRRATYQWHRHEVRTVRRSVRPDSTVRAALLTFYT
jgi:hypothetical protein